MKIAKVFISFTIIQLSGLIKKWIKNERGGGQEIIIFNLKAWNEQHEPKITQLIFHSLIKEQKGAATGSLLQKCLWEGQKREDDRVILNIQG